VKKKTFSQGMSWRTIVIGAMPASTRFPQLSVIANQAMSKRMLSVLRFLLDEKITGNIFLSG
jgi:hypothetical protein